MKVYSEEMKFFTLFFLPPHRQRHRVDFNLSAVFCPCRARESIKLNYNKHDFSVLTRERTRGIGDAEVFSLSPSKATRDAVVPVFAFAIQTTIANIVRKKAQRYRSRV